MVFGLVGYPLGIIPADAGSTYPAVAPRHAREDHPRGCGEHVGKTLFYHRVAGSSPRMRGAHGPVCHWVSTPGIIPADAGSTLDRSYMAGGSRDHPRGCGEHYVPRTASWCGTGSSPRMRGAPMTAHSRMHDCRIIPADAGSTVSIPTKRQRCGDHPRGCGEHSWFPPTPFWGSGSSPRMRGAQIVLCNPISVIGIIPADAGSTP